MYEFCARIGKVEPLGIDEQGNPTRDDITQLQHYVLSYGCSIGSTGVDGVFGTRTREGVQCLANNVGGLEVVASRFPFVYTLMGVNRPDAGSVVAIDPMTIIGNVAAAIPAQTSTGSPQTTPPTSVPSGRQALTMTAQPLTDAMKQWWFWGIIVVTTGAVFGGLMYRQHEQKKLARIASGEDEDRLAYRPPVYEDEESRPTMPMQIPDWARTPEWARR